MVNTENIYADGTFKTAPLLFYQIFTIHGIYNGHVVPLVYCLLPNKKEITYVTVLNKLKDLKPDLKPKSVMLDYELATLNAFQKVFPGIKCRGCIFHMNQSFYR